MYINRKDGTKVEAEFVDMSGFIRNQWEIFHSDGTREYITDGDFREQYGEAMICPKEYNTLPACPHSKPHAKRKECEAHATCPACIPYIPEEYDVDNEPTFPICGTCNYIKDKNLEQSNFPKIVCLCGSTRFKEQFFDTAKSLTCNRVIVLAPFHFRKCGDTITPELENILEELHFRKIDLADEILVLNIGGYIGESTRKEIEYAKSHNKIIGYLEEIE